MRLSHAELLKTLAKRGYAVDQDRGQLKGPKLERAPRHAALEPAKSEDPDSARFLVIVTSYRTRLLDEDNLAGKYHIDCLRYAGILPDDSPDKTHIQVRQIKVKKSHERTEIVITKL